MPLDQNPHQTVTRFGCIGFSMYACGFSVPQMRQFCLFTYPPRPKWVSSEKIFFFAKINTFCKSIGDPLSEAKTYWMVNWTLYGVIPKVFMQNSSQWCFWNVWERQWIFVDGASPTLSATAAAIFSGVRIIFGFSCFGLSMRMPASSKIRTQFSHTFCNILPWFSK